MFRCAQDDTLFLSEAVTGPSNSEEKMKNPGKTLRPARVSAIIKEKGGVPMPTNIMIWFIVLCLLGIAGCIVNIIKPEWGWKMRHWWDTVGGEPSEAYLYGTRMASVIGIIAFACVLLWLYMERNYG